MVLFLSAQPPASFLKLVQFNSHLCLM